MLLRWASVTVLGLAGAAVADDETRLVSDAYREPVVDARPAAPPADLLRHYEGLKHFARGRLLERRDRLPEAMRAYQAALHLEPAAVELMRVCIPINFKLERTVPALRLMRQALSHESNQPDLWLRYAQELLDLQRNEDAIRTARQALQAADFSSSPAYRADLYVVEAAAFDALQRHRDAVESYQQALRIIDDRERYLEDIYSPIAEELPAERAKLLERLARSRQKAGQFEQALDAFRGAEAAHPRKDGRLELNLAEVYLAAKQPAAALRHLRSCLEKKPTGDEAYRLFAMALRQSGQESDIIPSLQQWREEAPEHPALRLVLAEEMTVAGRCEEAGRLYREIMTVEPVPAKDVCQGYVRLLLRQGKGKQALEDYQSLCRRPASAAWARAMTLALLGEPMALQDVLAHAAAVEQSPTFRLLLLKMALQARLWPAAETLARQHVAKDPEPAEAYLLLCQGLLEQRRYAEVAAACQSALQNDAITQPLLFHLEHAKALAMTRQAEPALQALSTAKKLAAPNTTEEHKVLSTELFVLHLLGRHQDCVRQGEDLLKTDLAHGPWARQVRYVLAHAHEATSQFEQALKVLSSILDEDPNDDEAAAATARCLYLQNQRLGEAETWIREAIELDYVAQVKRNKSNPVPAVAKPNAAYQATLGAILLRAGRVREGISLLTELNGPELKPDPWVYLCLGDACLYQHRQDQAETYWKQAQVWAGQWATLGVDLRPSLQARLRAPRSAVTQTGAVSPAVPASSSSPPRP